MDQSQEDNDRKMITHAPEKAFNIVLSALEDLSKENKSIKDKLKLMEDILGPNGFEFETELDSETRELKYYVFYYDSRNENRTRLPFRDLKGLMEDLTFINIAEFKND